MTVSGDLRWRAVVLYLYQGCGLEDVSELLGVSRSAIKSWKKQFETTGTVQPQRHRKQSERWPQEVYNYIKLYIQEHPCFIFDELILVLKECFPAVTTFTAPTLCRALNQDMNLSRKVQ